MNKICMLVAALSFFASIPNAQSETNPFSQAQYQAQYMPLVSPVLEQTRQIDKIISDPFAGLNVQVSPLQDSTFSGIDKYFDGSEAGKMTDYLPAVASLQNYGETLYRPSAIIGQLDRVAAQAIASGGGGSRGSLLTGLGGSGGGSLGGLGGLINKVKQGVGIVNSLSQGRYSEALGGLGNVTGNQQITNASNMLQRGAGLNNIASSLNQGRYSEALGGLGNVTGNQQITNASNMLQRGAGLNNIASSLNQGRYSEALGGLGNVTGNRQIANASNALQQGTSLANAGRQVSANNFQMVGQMGRDAQTRIGTAFAEGQTSLNNIATNLNQGRRDTNPTAWGGAQY